MNWNAAVTITHIPAVFPTRTLDGDTFQAVSKDFGRLTMTIRVAHLDCPERGRPGHPAAWIALDEMLAGERVDLRPVPHLAGCRDRYGRLVCEVWSDEVDVAEAMIQGGWGRYWWRFGKARLHAEYLAAENCAQKQRLGLWAPANRWPTNHRPSPPAADAQP